MSARRMTVFFFSSPGSWPTPDRAPNPGQQLRRRLPGALGPEAGRKPFPEGPLCSGDGGLPLRGGGRGVFHN